MVKCYLFYQERNAHNEVSDEKSLFCTLTYFCTKKSPYGCTVGLFPFCISETLQAKSKIFFYEMK